MPTTAPDTVRHCAYCGHRIAGEVSAPERFGEPFCSEGHAEEFAAGVRAARTKAAARREETHGPATNMACAMPAPGQRNWRDYLKRAACWGAPFLLLLAIPLIWSGGWGATGGGPLGGPPARARPRGGGFMLRGMMGMQHGNDPRPPQAAKER